MSTYAVLLNWTEQGIKAAKDSPKRAQAFTQEAEKVGGRVLGIYWTMGRYDAVAILDAPDEKTVSRLMLALGALGNVRTETMRAYTTEEFSEIVAAL